ERRLVNGGCEAARCHCSQNTNSARPCDIPEFTSWSGLSGNGHVTTEAAERPIERPNENRVVYRRRVRANRASPLVSGIDHVNAGPARQARNRSELRQVGSGSAREPVARDYIREWQERTDRAR